MKFLPMIMAGILLIPAAAMAEPAGPEPPPTAPPQAAETLPTIAPPDGFVADKLLFNTDSLEGAAIHDATGKRMGEIHGLVFDSEGAEGTAAQSTGGITHAVIDLGGFLGLGEHRVAVPVKELVAYRRLSELRIYLPRTREQLMALPEYSGNGTARP